MDKLKGVILSAALLIGLEGCSSEIKYELPPGYKPPKNEEQPEVVIEPSKNTDLVLIYDGNKARTYRWTPEYLMDYVMYTDEVGKQHWLFDGFLVFDFRDSGGAGSLEKGYATGYKDASGKPLASANKSDWQYMIDRWVGDDGVCENLEATIDLAIKQIGDLPYQREIFIGIPEAIRHADWSNDKSATAYWGELNGRQLDFKNISDQEAAVDWFIDTVIKVFDAYHFKNIRLVGFYSINESFSSCADEMRHCAKYCKGMGYEYYWIPYYRAPGYDLWKSLGFTRAYMQPNYFFQQSANEDQVVNTCELAKKHNMYLEFECDDTVYRTEEGRRRFRKYMDGFIEGGCYDMPYAYYQSGLVFYYMKHGDAPSKQLYHEFCHWMIERPNRLTH